MFNKIKPHLIATLTFLVVSMAYFAPQYQDKGIRQFDNIQAKGTFATIYKHVEKHGEHPQWLDSTFGGMPSYTFDMEYRSKHLLTPIIDMLNFIKEPASFYFLLMLGFYFMAICFGISPWIAMIGSLAWGLSTYFYIIYTAGHIMKLVALIYVAPLIGSINYAYSRNLLLGGTLAALFTAIEIKSVHPQITYYFLFVILALMISVGIESYKQQKIKSFLVKSAALLGFALLGIGSNSVYLYYTAEYASESTRGKPIVIVDNGLQTAGLDKDYITAWSYGKGETLNMLVPNLYGGTSSGGFPKDGELRKITNSQIIKQLPAYWGVQPMTSGPVYIGAVIIFLFVLSLFLVRGPLFVAMISVTILALFLAWGKNMMWFTDLFIDYFPLYNKFRTVSMILVIIEFTIPFLAMFALQKIVNDKIEQKKKSKALIKSLIIVGGVLLLMFMFSNQLFSFSTPMDAKMGLPDYVIAAMQLDREDLMRADVARSLGFMLATAGCVFLMIRFKKKQPIWIGIVGLLIVMDLAPINKRYLNNDHFIPTKKAMEIPMTDVDRLILTDTTNYRVANFTLGLFNDATSSMHHRSVGGYSAVKPRRYQDLMDKYLFKQDIKIYSLLNTKYFIINKNDNGDIGVAINNEALGNIWFVNNVNWVDSPNKELDNIGIVDLAKTAVINNEFKELVQDKFTEPLQEDIIKQTYYKANKWVFEYETQGDRLAVLSEMYFPKGWSAKINGENIDLIRVNYDFFGLIVPKGKGEIIFEFYPPRLSLIDAIAFACITIILLLLVVAIFLRYRTFKLNRKNE